MVVVVKVNVETQPNAQQHNQQVNKNQTLRYQSKPKTDPNQHSNQNNTNSKPTQQANTPKGEWSEWCWGGVKLVSVQRSV